MGRGGAGGEGGMRGGTRGRSGTLWSKIKTTRQGNGSVHLSIADLVSDLGGGVARDRGERGERGERREQRGERR